MKTVIILNLADGENGVPPQANVWYIGLILDTNMLMDPQVYLLVSEIYGLSLVRNIRRIREHFNPQATEQVVPGKLTIQYFALIAT